jgi:hypothetical protein
MNAITMLDTIVPKSDQLNADDLIAGPRTIKITKALLTGEEQPVALRFEGDDNKPYKPGKSMRRVLVHIWGPDAGLYAGRSMTIYRDDKVVFGGVAVGGVRISHMSHMDREITIALTATRANRRPFTVKPLRTEQAPRQTQQDRGQAPEGDAPPLTLSQRAEMCEKRIGEAASTIKLAAVWKAAAALRADLDAADPERLVELEATFTTRNDDLRAAEREQD